MWSSLKNFLIFLRFFEKKAFCGCKSQMFVIGEKNARRGVRVGEAM